MEHKTSEYEENAFPSSSSQIESTQSYQPPHDSIMGPPVYPPAQQNPQPFYRPDYQFGYPQGKGKIFSGGYGEYYNSQWTLPPAWTESGVNARYYSNHRPYGSESDLMIACLKQIEGEGDTHQSISVMVQDTPVEETIFMLIKVESDDDLEEEDNQFDHHAFMFHPGPPTKIAEMVQSVGSWKPDKELPIKSKDCEHEWSENTVTNYTICYFCGILTTDTSRLNCPKCQLTTCALCARNYLGKTVNVRREQPQKQEEEKDFNNSNEVKLLKELLKEKTEQLGIEKKRLEELGIEKKRLEEQKDEEIRKLKAQLQKKEEEAEVQFPKEEFPPLGNTHVARPCVEAEVY
ncbi:hypothetical protein Tco_1313220 [Tanacetum coccineum]